MSALTVTFPSIAARHGRGVKGRGVLAWLKLADQVARERHALAEMTAEQRADLGLSYAETRAEATRAPWDLPAR